MDGSSDVQAPLHLILSVEDTVKLMETVTKQVSHGCYASLQPSIISLFSSLKRHGPSLELQHSSHLDRLQLVLRSACRDQNLDLTSRVHLLEMIELRTFNWAPSQQGTNYYKTKLKQVNGETLDGPHHHSPSAQGDARPASSGSHLHSLAGGHVNSSKSGLSHLMYIPNRPTTSNRFYPDRSPTSNPQQPPVKQKQLVVNLGVSRENATNSGDHSIEENIENVSVDDNGKRTITVNTKSGNIVLASVRTNLLRSVKRILQEELSDELLPVYGTSSSSLGGTKPELVYSRPELLELASSPLCRMPPPDWLSILSQVPSILKIKPVEKYRNMK